MLPPPADPQASSAPRIVVKSPPEAETTHVKGFLMPYPTPNVAVSVPDVVTGEFVTVRPVGRESPTLVTVPEPPPVEVATNARPLVTLLHPRTCPPVPFP